MINADPVQFQNSRIQKRILQKKPISCGSGMFIPDPNFSVPDPHQRI